jgi:hypothetical protein
VPAGTGLKEDCHDTLSELLDRAVVSFRPSLTTVAVAVPTLVTPAVVLCLSILQGWCDEAPAGCAFTASAPEAAITSAAARTRRVVRRKIVPFWFIRAFY